MVNASGVLNGTPALKQSQIDTLRFIANYTADSGYPPSFREMAYQFGVKSTNTVADRLWRLEKLGLLERGSFKRRAITLTAAAYQAIGGKPAVAGVFPSLGPITGYVDPPTMRCPDCARILFGQSHIRYRCLPEDVALVRGAA